MRFLLPFFLALLLIVLGVVAEADDDAALLGDLVCAVSMSRWLFVGHDLDDLAQVKAWYGRVCERTACQRHNVVSC